LIILLGSTRPAKVDGAREALKEIAGIDVRFSSPEIRTIDLTEVAPRMPLSEAAIVDGARRRASALVQSQAFVNGETFAVGLEGGLSPLQADGRDVWMLRTWAAVTDGQRWGYGAGGAVAVPDEVAERVLAGEELGDVIDALVGVPTRGTRGAWGVLTRDLVGRREAFRLAVLAAFAPFYNRSIWTSSECPTRGGSR
jgi:inosine/xanthosine triphosphatase